MTPEQMENATSYIAGREARFALDHQRFQEDLARI